jgi:signal transduction histidine kinase
MMGRLRRNSDHFWRLLGLAAVAEAVTIALVLALLPASLPLMAGVALVALGLGGALAVAIFGAVSLPAPIGVSAPQADAAEAETLWRQARLAELGLASAKVHHDLRNVLTSALLVADRLQESEDQRVARSGSRLVQSVEQATALLQAAADFAGEPPLALTPTRFRLRLLVDELAQSLAEIRRPLAVENRAPEALEVEADRAHFDRALRHVLHVAAQAQATVAVVEVEQGPNHILVVVTDDGQEFAPAMREEAFRAFSGCHRYGSSGLGLVIAREVMEAHGGAIALAPETPEGHTRIVLRLPA